MTQLRMKLTPELVALCQREVADPGPDPTLVYLDDETRLVAARGLLAEKPAGPFYVFAYGSLIWKPEFPTEETLRATAAGWHRAFSMGITRFRGSPDCPGLMMCLDRGGACDGVVLRLSDDDHEGQMVSLLKRELSRAMAVESVRWIDVSTAHGPKRALAFYAGPTQLDHYTGGLPLPEVAKTLARACGHWGSGADYLYNTVSHLEQLGIHDENLWALQALVAEEIAALHGLAAPR
jgi:glutathione-specific gamma-glutamylcyclotransferase